MARQRQGKPVWLKAEIRPITRQKPIGAAFASGCGLFSVHEQREKAQRLARSFQAEVLGRFEPEGIALEGADRRESSQVFGAPAIAEP